MSLDTFVGNPNVVGTLREMLRAGRVPGTLLFSGPDGVGKRTLAVMLAQALNCERRHDDFCGECRRCRQVAEMVVAARDDLARRRELKDAARRAEGLVYFDVQLIEPLTRFILTEQVRELRRIAYTRPFELPRRVFILDQAQTIHWQAVDVLLKVLEEPPETTTFILIAPNAAELRPTLRSRAERMAFAPVEEETLLRLIDEKSTIPKAQRRLAARLADGSVAKALAFDPEAYAGQRRPWLDFLESVTARPPGNAGAPPWKALFDSAKALSDRREDFEEVLKTGYRLLLDLLRVMEGGESGTSDPDLFPRLERWGKQLGLAGIERLKDGLDEAYRLQTRNVNQQLGFETLGIDVMARRAAQTETEPSVG